MPSASAPESAVPSPSLEPTPGPLASFDPFGTLSDWPTYTSEVYGTRIGYPAGWTVVPASRAWEFDTDADSTSLLSSSGADQFSATDGGIVVTVWTASVDGGMTVEEWVSEYCELVTRPCTELEARLDPALRETADQHQVGVIIEFADDVQAFMPSWIANVDPNTIWTTPAPAEGGDLIVIASGHPADTLNSRDLVDAFSLKLLCSPECDAP